MSGKKHELSEQAVNFVRENAESMTDKVLLTHVRAIEQVDVSLSCVRECRINLHGKRSRGRPKKLTAST